MSELDAILEIVTTSDDCGELERIARTLVDQRLAACCQIGAPVTSIYDWQGQVEEAQEHTLHIKTTAPQFDAVADRIAELHHYDVPQVIGRSLTRVSEPYAAWVRAQVG